MGGDSTGTSQLIRLWPCAQTEISPRAPAQTTLFNTRPNSKLSFTVCAGTTHSTGNDNNLKSSSECPWAVLSELAQLNHCKAACRTKVAPIVTKTADLLNLCPMPIPSPSRPILLLPFG